MELREDIHKWLEGMNPLLLLNSFECKKELKIRKLGKLFPETKVLIIAGVDSFDFQEALEKGIKVLLVEEDVEKISALLLKENFKVEKNLFISTSSKEQIFPIIKKFTFQKVQYEGSLGDIPSYIDGMHMSFSEYRDLGEDILPNILSNLLHIDRYIDGRDFVDLLLGEEVIVAGSGISLEKGIEEIKGMQARPFIISVGSSLPVLVDAGIIPDFYAVIDPCPPLEIYECLKDLSVPLFYQNRASRDILFMHKGPKVFMGSSKGWQIEDALMNEMGRESFSFDAGCHAGNFGAHIALALGAKKVVLVGMDGVSKEGEDVGFEKSGMVTRNDLYYGMDFLKTLKGEFLDQELVHYTRGFAYDEDYRVSKLHVAPKKGILSFPKEHVFQGEDTKRVIDGYFDHGMLSSLQSFFVKIKEEPSMTDVFSSCILAEFAMLPFYLHFISPLWDIWKHLMAEPADVLCKLSFYYKVLSKFSENTGIVGMGFVIFGKKEGAYSIKDKRGMLREEGYYFNGKLVGCVKQYDEMGSLIVSQEMDKGLRHGMYQTYRDGILLREGMFYKGKADGKHLCHEDGRVVDQVCYDKGEKTSNHKYYSKSGLKLEEIQYKEGGLFDKFQYDKEGRMKYSGTWKNSIFTEKSYEDGREIISRMGKIVGNKMVYNEDEL